MAGALVLYGSKQYLLSELQYRPCGVYTEILNQQDLRVRKNKGNKHERRNKQVAQHNDLNW